MRGGGAAAVSGGSGPAHSGNFCEQNPTQLFAHKAAAPTFQRCRRAAKAAITAAKVLQTSAAADSAAVEAIAAAGTVSGSQRCCRPQQRTMQHCRSQQQAKCAQASAHPCTLQSARIFTPARGKIATICVHFHTVLEHADICGHGCCNATRLQIQMLCRGALKP